ncbi:MAG: amidohydrolase family protein [Pyrinomonadaceae bacterium]
MQTNSLILQLTFILFGMMSTTVSGQTSAPAPAPTPQPVIDMHWHAPGASGLPATFEMMKTINLKYAVMIGTYDQLRETKASGNFRFLPALMFPCENGRLPNIGIKCFEDAGMLPPLAQLRERAKNGDIKVFAELSPQYLGMAPDDSRLEPYYALAEELDLPVGIHMGIGPPAVAYNKPGFPPVKSPNYRGAAGSPLLLEELLLRHPKLRLYVMHAAYPFRDEMIYMLYMHPQLYVDVAVLQWAIPRAAYLRFLQELVEAGFAKRIMFGSDGGPEKLKAGVEAILQADFITPEQKADILYNNAARFLRLE